MAHTTLAHQTALVTGASSGLGADFARELARRGAGLVLVARREEQLRALAAEIEAQYGIHARVITVDLALPDARLALYDTLQAQGVHVDILVNNAGFGAYGLFHEIPWERDRAMLDLDVLALNHLTHLFLPDMLAADHGFILLVASIAAYQPSPTYASYAGAKAYVLTLGETLNYELRKTGVGVTVLSPGVTATQFFQVAGQSLTLYQRLVMMQSADVARTGISAMLRRRASIVPGWINALLVFLCRLSPRRLQAAVANLLMQVK